jgi:phosphoribosylamine---glycine ligase
MEPKLGTVRLFGNQELNPGTWNPEPRNRYHHRVTVLILGSGGREHALAWRLSRDACNGVTVCAPGNPGIARIARLEPLDVSNSEAAVALAQRLGADLTVVGPELPLSRGVVNRFQALGLPILGPTRAAAALECSKAFAKAFMARHGVPTAAYSICESADEALDVLASERFGFPVVLKADGLAAGKGVVVAEDGSTAEAAVREIMLDRRFGSAGDHLVIEECLEGPELSYFVLSDGERVLPLGSAQDHKRVFDDDRGPNTGGMGAFAPTPLCDKRLERQILDQVVRPVIDGMRAEGTPYQGFLYCGLMLTHSGPKVIEFNVRFGDPEAQVVLPLLEGDLLGALRAAAAGDVRGHHVALARACTVGVVLASGGYPGAFETDKPIEGLEDVENMPDVTVFHAGTARRDGQLVTAGGRVLTVVGRGPDHATAMARAYAAVDHISFPGMHARKDIGRRAFNSECGMRNESEF